MKPAMIHMCRMIYMTRRERGFRKERISYSICGVFKGHFAFWCRQGFFVLFSEPDLRVQPGNIRDGREYIPLYYIYIINVSDDLFQHQQFSLSIISS